MAFVEGQVVKISEHAVHHALVVVLFFVIGSLVGVIVHRWKQHYWGCRLNVYMCSLNDGPMGKISFESDKIWEGLASDYLRNFLAAGILTRAARWTKSGLLRLSDANQKKVMELFATRIRGEFKNGFLANALDDADVTKRSMMLGLFKDSTDSVQVTLLLITVGDWVALRDKADKIVVFENANQLAWARSLDEKTSVRIRLYS